MESKQYTPKWPMGQRRNPKRNQKYLETNENNNTTHQNFWDAAKDVLRGKFTLINAYIKKKRSQMNNLTLHLKEIGKKT